MLADKLIKETKILKSKIKNLDFSFPAEYVYNPLDYAWKPYCSYINKYNNSQKKIIYLGMNPGPWGMAQVGVPFGEISLVRNWLHINDSVSKPKREHPKRPVEGFSCEKSEVSGRRLWGLFKEKYGKSENFFKIHTVLNYCPLIFMKKSSSNITPDKLKKNEREILFNHCDNHLKKVVSILKPDWIIGVGVFAEKRLKIIFQDDKIKIGKILHPSPANPAANRDWAGSAAKQLKELGIWK